MRPQNDGRRLAAEDEVANSSARLLGLSINFKDPAKWASKYLRWYTSSHLGEAAGHHNEKFEGWILTVLKSMSRGFSNSLNATLRMTFSDRMVHHFSILVDAKYIPSGASIDHFWRSMFPEAFNMDTSISDRTMGWMNLSANSSDSNHSGYSTDSSNASISRIFELDRDEAVEKLWFGDTK